MKKIVSLIIICLLICGCGNKYQIIDSNKAMDLINNYDTVIIDVRDNNEFRREHIFNSINVPLDDINKINYDKDKIIILYCNVGELSKKAANKLVNIGYNNVYSLDGGLLNWGFDLED